MNQILHEQFRTYVFIARTLKDNNQSSWHVYVFQAQQTLEKINLIKEDVTKTMSYGKVIFLDKKRVA